MRLRAATAALCLILAACGSSNSNESAEPEPDESAETTEPAAIDEPAEITEDDLSRDHVEGPISYDRNPPLGGVHTPTWQNCGYYAVSVPTERAVHSLEHGSIWIAYSPDLDTAEVDVLSGLAGGQTHILVSPVDSLAAPIVATAWGRQINLDQATDPALSEFIDTHIGGGPEPGAPCAGSGEGVPPNNPGGAP